ncbi:hypothetical protein H3H39_03870 [Duganella sp. LX47W]|uniref:Teneurin NHL domain-containing protein n=2 Tax=Rugamonas apoptosis TaxID=2758570 RepID=A0A7W2F6T9_9BURK|nr:hypothetical protein [Rugamonas apoptosis]
MARGGAYNVSIASQPPGFTDICALSGGTGTASDVNAINIAVSCRPAVAVVTTFAGSGTPGHADGAGAAASFNGPGHIAVDAAGNLYVADTGNHTIRKITPDGNVSTLAGSGTPGNANGMGAAASFNNPSGVAVDATGNVYVADFRNNLIRKITPAGLVTTLAGDGSHNSANGAAMSASFAFPGDVTLDSAGNLYVADVDNYLIRKVSPAGLVSTYAGIGSPAMPYYGNGPAATASFNLPASVRADASGNVYVADNRNNSIRKISADGMVTSVAGDLYAKSGRVNGTGTAATFSAPNGIAMDASGNIYVADSGNNLIRKISAAGVVTTIAGNASDQSVNGTGTAASFRDPAGVAVDGAGNVYVSDSGSNLIRKISAQ